MNKRTCHLGPQEGSLLPRRDSPWLWLPYLLILGFPWLARPPRPEELQFAAVAVPIFLFLYFKAFSRQDLSVLPYAAGMVVLCFVGSYYISTSSIFIAYAAAGIGWMRPLSLALKSLAGLLAIIAIAWIAFDFPMIFLGPALLFSLMTGFACVLSAESVARETALIASQKSVERLATLAERDRIAKDLHDMLGHQLSVVAVKADLASKLLERDPKSAARELGDIQNMAREALHELRIVVDDMKQASVAAEIQRARTALEASDVYLDAGSQLPPVPRHLERPVALVIREAVTNIIRHAGADRCSLTVERQEDALIVQIHDNGRGGIKREGHGIAGMRERVRQLGGRFSMDGGDGTRLLATFPLAEESAS